MQSRLSVKQHKVTILKATLHYYPIGELAIKTLGILHLHWLISLSVLSGFEQMKNLTLFIELSDSVDVK
jgi:hypothetical protein